MALSLSDYANIKQTFQLLAVEVNYIDHTVIVQHSLLKTLGHGIHMDSTLTHATQTNIFSDKAHPPIVTSHPSGG